jgi:hypothetical protein
MDRLRLLDLRIPVAEVLNVCASSPEVVTMVNRVERRLLRLKGGKWLGATARMRICTAATGCLAWPRQIETIEGFQICNIPGTVRNGWYEFSVNGPGLLNADSSWYNNLIDRGTLPTFDVPSSNTAKVGVTGEVGEAVGARILLRGYDQNGAWIRTEEPAASGIWIDGEYVAIEGGVTHYSTKLFSAISGVIKPVTNGPVTLWQYDVPTAAIVKQLAYYEPTEEVPIYRASLLPGLATRRGCPPQTNCGCRDEDRTQVTVVAKLRHIDVADDNDFLVLGCEAAFALGAQAVLKEKRNLWEEAQKYWASAERELQGELSSFEGDGAIPTYKTEGRSTWGAGVQNSISLGWPISW